jgi:hypothetical protein
VALRVLSGILITSRPEGRATIRFRPHEVEGDARGVGLREIGASGEFRGDPATLFALREVALRGEGSAGIDERMRSEALVEIGWAGAGEISYLVIGETDER